MSDVVNLINILPYKRFSVRFEKDSVTDSYYITDIAKDDMRKVISIDVDGVLYDLIKALNKTSHFLRQIPIKDNALYDYDFTVYPEWVRSKIFECFRHEPVWGYDDCLYDNALEFLQSIVEYVDKDKYAVVLHTMVLTKECGGYRYNFWDKLLRQLKLSEDVYMCIDIAKKRVMPNCAVIIDDYLENIKSSIAPIKLVPVHRYNTVSNRDGICVLNIDGEFVPYWQGMSYYSLFNAFVCLYEKYNKGMDISKVDYENIDFVPVDEDKCFVLKPF